LKITFKEKKEKGGLFNLEVVAVEVLEKAQLIGMLVLFEQRWFLPSGQSIFGVGQLQGLRFLSANLE
jgi:hypothetical protein